MVITPVGMPPHSTGRVYASAALKITGFLALLALLVLVVSPTRSASAAAGATSDPLIGDWNVTYGNATIVTISGSGGSYAITAKDPVQVTGSSCFLPPGTLIATFSGSGNTFSGQHGLWFTSDCSFGEWTSMQLTLNADGNTLTAVLGGGAFGTVIFTKINAAFSPADKAYLQSAAHAQDTASGGFGAAALVCVFLPPPFDACAIPFGLISTASWGSSLVTDALAKDPPDSNYTVVYVPVVLSLPPLTAGPGLTQVEVTAFNSYLDTAARAIAYGRAVAISIDRAASAGAAGNTLWKSRQTAAAYGYAQVFSGLLDKEADQLASLATVLHNNHFPRVTVTPADVISMQQGIAQNGLPSSLTQGLTQLGFSPADIAQVRVAALAVDPNAAAGTFPDKFADPSLLASLHQAAQGLRADIQAREDQVLSALLAEVQGLGPGKSLSAKLGNAQARLEAGDTAGACAGLASFGNEVHAQAGKSIPNAQAQQLVEDADQVQTALGCA